MVGLCDISRHSPAVLCRAGSYAPVVLAGATYGWLIGWLIGYITMTLSPALNLLFVRFGCKPLIKRCCRNRLARLQIDVIEFMLKESPCRIVALLRLPVIASGILNYLFSLSDNLPIAPYMAGNIVGNIPGTLLFSVLGTSVNSIGKAVLNGNADPKGLAVACVILVIVVSVIVGSVILVRRALARMKEQRHIGSPPTQADGGVVVDIVSEVASPSRVDAACSPPVAAPPDSPQCPTPRKQNEACDGSMERLQTPAVSQETVEQI